MGVGVLATERPTRDSVSRSRNGDGPGPGSGLSGAYWHFRPDTSVNRDPLPVDLCPGPRRVAVRWWPAGPGHWKLET